MPIDLAGVHDLLVYFTRISEFKSKENYIPFLTFYKTKFNKSIEQTFSEYFQENITVTNSKVEFSDICDNLFTYLDFIDNKITKIGDYEGVVIYQNLKEEFSVITDGMEKLEWSKVESDFMLSFSVSGSIFVAKNEDDLIIFDFGFSD
jgi:hypothetical protein